MFHPTTMKMGEGEPAPPPSKKAKTSSNNEDRGAHSATSASETRLRTVSSKQAALNHERVATKNTRVETLRKQLAKAKKDAQMAQKEPCGDIDEKSCESEERDPEGEVGFHPSITKLPSITPAGKKKATKPVLHRTNLMAEQAALANPPKVSNKAFLAFDRRSSSPELYIQHTGIGDHRDQPTSPSFLRCYVIQSHNLSGPNSNQKGGKVHREGTIIGQCPKAADYEEVVAALLVRAMFDYEGLVSTHDVPDISLRRQWTLRCWKQALRDADERTEISERMMTLHSLLSSHILIYYKSDISYFKPQVKKPGS